MFETGEWIFTGQPSEEWPARIRFKNYAHDEKLTKVIFHQLDEQIVLLRGEVLFMALDGHIKKVKRLNN